MRREGRQRGMVRTISIIPATLNPRAGRRILNKLDSPPTAGLFERVPRKPTNHSKFTGKCDRPKCSGCHLHPVSKAKDKAKGAQKAKSFNDKLSYKTICWSVMADEDGSDKTLVSGYSASKILHDLSYDQYHDYHNDDDDFNPDDNIDFPKSSCGLLSLVDDSKVGFVVDDTKVGFVVDDTKVGFVVDDVNGDDIIIHGGVTVDDDDGYDGFFDIAGVWNAVDDDDDDDDEDGWSIVGGI